MIARWARIGALAALAAASVGCGASHAVDGDADADGDADGDADADSDIDADADSDTDSDSDPDLDQDPDLDWDGCSGMNARAVGDCEMELPGIIWNGARCVPLGSGCACEGPHCGLAYATVAACVEAWRDCYDDFSCEPMTASHDSCWDCEAPVFLGAFWDGMGCHVEEGCDCTGDGCARGLTSLEECQALSSVCDAALCLSTGGDWHRGDTCTACGPHVCGVRSGDDCCGDGCDCGAGRSFETSRGCVADPSCSRESLCRATHGTWHPLEECLGCTIECGVPTVCVDDCAEICECGPTQVFDEARGCVHADRCDAPTERELCLASGGRWAEGEGCGHFTCGRPNLLDPCVMPGCDCGPRASFDSERGCVASADCIMPGEGDDCSGGRSCRPGLVCCGSCGAYDCSTCQAPCCEGVGGCQPDGCPPPTP